MRRCENIAKENEMLYSRLVSSISMDTGKKLRFLDYEEG